MSQVVVTRDSYSQAREASRRQERSIDVEQAVSRWRRKDTLEPKWLWTAALAGAVAAIVAFGSLILACSLVAFAITLGIARLLFRRRQVL